MSRNQLYKNRLELCLTNEQNTYIRKLAKKQNRRINEIMRIIIDAFMENGDFKNG